MSVSPTHQLKHPPINEVVCGFIFEPTTLTALDFGDYWEQRRDQCPRYELLHPFSKLMRSV